MSDIARALAGGLDPEVAISRETLRYAVARRITCPLAGKLLDVRSAVYYALTTASGKTGSEVCDAAAWDEIRDVVRDQVELIGGSLEVIDGRELFGGGR
jgi:hypothetical protein